MTLLTQKAVIVIDDIEYPNLDLSVNFNGDHFQVEKPICNFTFSKIYYKALLVKENGFLEYDCNAQDENGHIKNFKLRFPNVDMFGIPINIIRTLR